MLEVEGEWPYCFELIGSIVQPIGFFTLIHMFGYFKKIEYIGHSFFSQAYKTQTHFPNICYVWSFVSLY